MEGSPEGGWDMKGWFVEESNRQRDVIEKVCSKVWSHLMRSYKLVTDELVGIDSHLQQVTRLLSSVSGGVKIVGIHGMRGIGEMNFGCMITSEILADQLFTRRIIKYLWKRSKIWSNEDALDILKSGELGVGLM
ncbi:Disease resistance protein L6 [Linum perenne]